MASGLDKVGFLKIIYLNIAERNIIIFVFIFQCGVGSQFPIKYSHLDIAGAAGDIPENATGAPILGLYAKFLNESFVQLADN